jgi:hypothetical protein
MGALCCIRSILFVAILALAACGFEAPAPQRTPLPAPPLPPLSTLAATLTIPATEIARALDEKTKSEIADIRDQPLDCAIAKCRLSLQAVRSGAPTVIAANNGLSLTLPLSVTAQVAVKGPFFKTTANATATGAASMTTALALGPDWRVRSRTSGVVTLSKAQLKLGPLKMDVADLWNRNAERFSQPLFKTLDRHIASTIGIKPQAERLWAKATYPIKVGKSPQAWLLLAPEQIRVAQPVARDNALTVSVGLDVRAQIVVADHAPEPAKIEPLPSPEPLSAPSNRFSFVVPVLLPYDEAAGLALQRLVKAPLRVGGMTVRFETLSILPSGSDVIVAARFCVKQGWDPFGWFDSCGDGYLRGMPQFDPQTGKIRIARVHYDIATENILLSALRALAGDALGKALETRLVFDPGPDIARLDAQIKSALARPQGRGVRIRGNVESFGTPSLTWTREGFLATFPAQGTIAADLNLYEEHS